MTEGELADSLLFFRRSLARVIVRDVLRSTLTHGRLPEQYFPNLAQYAEDLANAITERLAARETGKPGGYSS